MAPGRKSRIGIRDVAASAGVSNTTVSHALSGKGRLPEATRERIVRIARELGYRPNANARNLVNGKTGLIGVAVSSTSAAPFGLSDFDYFVRLLGAATGTAVENGRALVIEGSQTGDLAFSEAEVDGAIVVDPVDDDQTIPSLRERGVPVVTTGREKSETLATEERFWVDNDHRSSTIEMLEHLAERGGERIGLITGPEVNSYTRDAIAGYREWCEEKGQSPMVALAEGTLNESSGFNAAEKLLGLENPPNAIYSIVDYLSLGALNAARANSITVPDELLIGCGIDSPLSLLSDPPLTALSLNPEKIGRAAVELLVEVIDGDQPTENPMMIETEIICRASTGC
jgi:DNA-binding LacI/PurR family transcriptional regulator